MVCHGMYVSMLGCLSLSLRNVCQIPEGKKINSGGDVPSCLGNQEFLQPEASV